MIYQLKITVLLRKDVHFRESSYRISELINKSLLGNADMKDKHRKNEYKFYVFDNLFPRSEDKFYRKDRLYVFNIRTPLEKIRNNLADLLVSVTTNFFTVVSIAKPRMEVGIIKELMTVTPAVMTIDGSYWTLDRDLEELKQGINNNLLKKYKTLYGEKEDLMENKFFYDVEILNQKPIGIKYKNISFLSHKIKLKIKEDDESQNLAKLALATGILERNSSCGMGYCIYKSY
ncbi:CRISPR-associated endoribonuclease Cas6 [Wukongibacter sp. M2B1]|uniref:CRISPR-associated endoribonuclease Cas6 n=1 Tax=Wukongibacter sp. M2B1 TaxID=3088895 RepID=UPI003D7B39EF